VEILHSTQYPIYTKIGQLLVKRQTDRHMTHNNQYLATNLGLLF